MDMRASQCPVQGARATRGGSKEVGRGPQPVDLVLRCARYVGNVSESELVLRSAYSAFNARDVEATLELMHPRVDWPNAWEGGRGELLSESSVRHRYQLEDGMVMRMDVLEPTPAGPERR